MKKAHLICVIFLGVTTAIGCAGMQRKSESANFKVPKNYEIKHAKTFDLKGAYLTRFVVAGDSIDKWTESMEIFNTWKKNYPPSPEEAYKKLEDERRKKCPESTFNVISKDNNSILWETKTLNCSPNPDENSITRILYGNTDVFMLIYTNKINPLPKEKKDEWAKVLSEAKISVRE